MSRRCVIVDASIEDAEGHGDGAYDLLDVEGTPKHVGRAIASSLAESDLVQGGRDGVCALKAGKPLFVTVRIRIDPEQQVAWTAKEILAREA